MTLAEFKTQLETSGLPVAYNFFPEEATPEGAFITWVCTTSSNFSADNRSYGIIRGVEVTLWSRTKDITSEEAVETALSDFAWESEEIYHDDEKCYEIVYSLNLI